MMEILPLEFDDYVGWVLQNVPVDRQPRKIVEMFEMSAEFVRNKTQIIQTLNPANFMFVERGIHIRFVGMLNCLSKGGTDWRVGVAAPFNQLDNVGMNTRLWLNFYLNKKALTAANIAKLDFQVCKIILAQLKAWYTSGMIRACCLIEYIDQIKMILCQAGTPEYICIFNSLAAAYEASAVSDCADCQAAGAATKRNSRYKDTKAVKNIIK